MCRQHIDQVVHINTLQAEYEGSRIVKVHEDPHTLDELASLARRSAVAGSAAAPATAAAGVVEGAEAPAGGAPARLPRRPAHSRPNPFRRSR